VPEAPAQADSASFNVERSPVSLSPEGLARPPPPPPSVEGVHHRLISTLLCGGHQLHVSSRSQPRYSGSLSRAFLRQPLRDVRHHRDVEVDISLRIWPMDFFSFFSSPIAAAVVGFNT
jgi:hypothetical protein